MNNGFIRVLLACVFGTASFSVMAADQVVDSAKAQAKPRVDAAARARAAEDALATFIRDYEAGDVIAIEQRLDPGMVGYQSFVDGIRQDVNSQKQMRLELKDKQVLAGPDVAVIQFRWEKRFLGAASFQASLQQGNTMMLMHRQGAGWQVAALSGDNPFAAARGIAGQITLPDPVMMTCVPAACPPTPVIIEVSDPDLAGSMTLNVEFLSSNGDRETLSLMEVAPGRFQRSSLPFQYATPTVGDGLISAVGIGTLTLRYMDNNPGGGRGPTVLSRTVRVQ